VLVCNSLERFGSALDPVGQAVVPFDRQLTDDLVFAPRSIVSELGRVIDILASGIFVVHFRPAGWLRLRGESLYPGDPAKTPGAKAGRFALQKLK
jgi:hypothetical protein